MSLSDTPTDPVYQGPRVHVPVTASRRDLVARESELRRNAAVDSMVARVCATVVDSCYPENLRQNESRELAHEVLGKVLYEVLGLSLSDLLDTAGQTHALAEEAFPLLGVSPDSAPVDVLRASVRMLKHYIDAHEEGK